MTGHEEFREWSAAYVLGALEPTERQQFEDHLTACDICRAEVSAFAPLPGLLNRAGIPSGVTPSEEAVDLALGGITQEWNRVLKRERLWRWIAGAAAAVVVFALAFSIFPTDTASSGTVLAMTGPAAAGEVTLETRQWGTAIELVLSDLPTLDRYTAWAVDRGGAWQQVAVWGPTSTGAAHLSGSSSFPISEIDRIEVTSADRTETIATTSAP